MEERFEIINKKWWQCVTLYSRACKEKFFVEALIFAVYMIKASLLNLINSKLKQEKRKMPERLFKNEIKKLSEFASGNSKKYIPKSLHNKISSFYEKRGAVVHGILKENKDIDYRKIEKIVEDSTEIIKLLQELTIGKARAGKPVTPNLSKK